MAKALIGIGSGVLGLLGVMGAAAMMSASSRGIPAPDFPQDLRATGLYSDFASKTVDARNLHYAPQYPLWSDGAAKERWIFLPPGQTIDASDPDIWSFPAGTKVWKEFSFGGRRVETRLIQAIGGGRLAFAAYAWNANETAAVLVPQDGLKDVIQVRPGIGHDIPGVWDCRACHVGDKDEILGFSALQLSPDRDPGAPHAEPFVPGMADLSTLIDRNLLRPFPASWIARPPRIAAPTAVGRSALGYMHSNCGNCHNPSGPLEAHDLFLRYILKPGTARTAVVASIGHPSHFPIPGAEPGTSFLLDPGDPDHSAVVYRMSTRNPLRQMPPLGTEVADDEAVSLVRRWIAKDLKPGTGHAADPAHSKRLVEEEP